MIRSEDVEESLRDILSAARKAQAFVADMTFDAFAADDKTTFAVVRALEIIGEATKRIPMDFRGVHLAVPWRAMAGIRDKLIHDYSRINLLVVWNTVQNDLPQINAMIEQLVQGLPNEDPS